MNFDLLHLNVERNKHTDAVFSLLKERKPQLVCLAEVMYKDVLLFSSTFGYEFAFAPLIFLKNNNENDQEGSAILSKYKILEINKHRYDDGESEEVPVLSTGELIMKDGERPKERFLYHYTLLSVLVELSEESKITVSTTHFPVTDHTTPGHVDHELKSLKNIDDVEHSEVYLNRLIEILRSITTPIIFTSDLNNPRGEFFYDSIAHELVDRVPSYLKSSIDPNIHRVKNLELLVDTIMTSPDVNLNSFEVIEGVSDHKGYLASLNI